MSASIAWEHCSLNPDAPTSRGALTAPKETVGSRASLARLDPSRRDTARAPSHSGSATASAPAFFRTASEFRKPRPISACIVASHDKQLPHLDLFRRAISRACTQAHQAIDLTRLGLRSWHPPPPTSHASAKPPKPSSRPPFANSGPRPIRPSAAGRSLDPPGPDLATARTRESRSPTRGIPPSQALAPASPNFPY